MTHRVYLSLWAVLHSALKQLLEFVASAVLPLEVRGCQPHRLLCGHHFQYMRVHRSRAFERCVCNERFSVFQPRNLPIRLLDAEFNHFVTACIIFVRVANVLYIYA